MEFVVFSAAVLAFVLGIQYLRTRKRQEERQMLHRERMLAMEKGVPLPELPNPEENSSGSLLDQLPIPRKDALVKLTLGCGILLFFLGFGIIVAFMLAPNEAHLNQAWTLGFIPLLVGCGSLLYSLLIRRSHS